MTKITKLEIKPMEVAKVIEFLKELNIKGLAGIHRSKIANHLTKKLEELIEGEKTIQEDFADDKEKLAEEMKLFLDEDIVISGDEFVKPLHSLKAQIKKIVLEEELEFSGEKADTLLFLYEAFDLDLENDENEKEND